MCVLTQEIVKELNQLFTEFAEALAQIQVDSSNIGKVSCTSSRSFNELMAYGIMPQRLGVQVRGNAIWRFYDAKLAVDIYYAAVIVPEYGEHYFNFDVNETDYYEPELIN